MILFIPLIWFANKEINDMFFRSNIKKTLFSFLVSLVIFLSISSIMITINYGFLNSQNNNFIFLLVFFLVFFLSCVFLGIYLKSIKFLTKDVFTFIFLLQMFNLFSVSFLYLSIVKA